MDRCRALVLVAVVLGLAACGNAGSGREQPTGQAGPPKGEKVAATGAPKTAAGGQPALPNPCSLVSKAEIEKVAKQPVLQEAQQGTCLNRGNQPGSTLVVSMAVTPLPSKSPQALDAVAQAVAGLVPGASREPLPGVGDDARIVRSEVVSLLFVKTGDRYLTISVAGSDDPLAVLKTLATHALQRL